MTGRLAYRTSEDLRFTARKRQQGLWPRAIKQGVRYKALGGDLRFAPKFILERGSTMDRETMSNEENYCFDVAGYLHVPGVLNRGEVEALNRVLDEIGR